MENQAIHKEMESIRTDINNVDRKVTSLIHLLTGSEFDKELGMIAVVKYQEKEIELLKERVDKLEKRHHGFFWALFGMSMPATYGIVDIVKAIFK